MSGMIGAGKTLYTKRLSEQLGTEPFYEPVDDNPILEKYYEDPERYGFALQIYFLNKRFDLIKQAYRHDNNVLDRSIFEDKLFTYVNVLEGNITEEEYEIYISLLDNMMEELEGMPKKAPDLLIHLDASFEQVLENIKKRGREYEQVEDNKELLEYYRTLHTLYEDWYNEYDVGPKMRIKVDKYDIHNEDEWEQVFLKIEKRLEEIR